MSFARSAMAILLAISVAMLPVAGNAMLRASGTDMSAVAPPGDMSAMAATDEMSATDMDMDCCPHQADHSGKATDSCTVRAACGLCCGIAFSSHPAIVFSFVPAVLGRSFLTYAYRSLPGHPPFRPPRV